MSLWLSSLALVAQLAAGTPLHTVAQSPDSADRVAPGDRLIVRVWREPGWSDSISVAADGRIVLPRVGPIHVAGLPPTVLSDSIRTLFAAYIRDPVVDVIVLRRIAVLGAVRKPNVYFVDPVASLRDVLAQAGGLEDDGDPNRIAIVRGGASQRLGKWSEISERTVPVRSGDDIIVGKKAWLTRNPSAAISTLTLTVSVLVAVFRR